MFILLSILLSHIEPKVQVLRKVKTDAVDAYHLCELLL